MNLLKVLMMAGVALGTVVLGGNGADAAPIAKWDVRPAFSASGLSEYGWHFDETSGQQWGARDFNHGSDALAPMYLRIRLTQNAQYPMRWRCDSTASCAVKAFAQVYAFGVWQDLAGAELHYIHLNNKVANGTVTSSIQWNGDALPVQVGKTAHCGTTEYHAHQSADFGPGTRQTGVRYSTDTCWSDHAGSYSYQCPGGAIYKAHTNGSGCPPGAWNTAYWFYSGTVPQYICEEWSWRSHGSTTAVF